MVSATSVLIANARLLGRRRWLRMWHTEPPTTRGFFDDYPRFLLSSETEAKLHRLNERHRALIQANADIIKGKRVLDLASHDGRWSFAAGKAGASYVLGIEARPHLVEAARNNVLAYGADNVEFIQGDVMNDLHLAGHFDTVFCFGFLYHTIDHMPLLRAIRNVDPKHVIIDTVISLLPNAMVEVGTERVDREGAAAFGDGGAVAVIGKPTKLALEQMLAAIGFSEIRYYNWRGAGISCWNDLELYYLGSRVTLRADRTGHEMKVLSSVLAKDEVRVDTTKVS